MEAERWKKIEGLYQAAIAQPPEKRAEFLAQACPADAGLRGEVQSLLAQQADSFLESSPVSAIKTLSPGAKLANFEIVELIGRGGMGEVYRARDSRLKRDVAIKVLPAGLARDPDRIARFEREARAAGALNHPNIVAVYEIGRDGDTYWIATELVAGESLAKAIEHGPLGVPRALEIARQIVDGLAAAHAAGIVHRDLKPANLMVTRDGRVKILDFGLALRQRTSQDSTTIEMTDEGTVMGTAGYMSPEQVRGEVVDHRSDLFSFGVIFYEMLGGKRAFAGGSSVEVMSAILKDDPPELPASVPPVFDRIMRRCLQKDRELRFQTAADLLFALQFLPHSPTQVERPKRSAWSKWATLGAATIMAVAVYWLGARRPSPSAPAEFVLRRLTNGAALTSNAVISPDGKLVAYDQDGAIWVQQVDSDTAIRLTDDPAEDSDPAFSADGAQIAFRSEREGGGIYVVPSLGGAARELVPEGRFPSFSPDGRWLSYWTGPEADKFGSKLFVRPLSSVPAVQVGAEIATSPCGAVWSPDSSRILFLAKCTETTASVWVYTVGRKELKRNPDLHLSEDDIDQWIANPPRLLIGKRVADVYEVTAVPISADGTKVTGTPQRLTSVTDRLLSVSASLDGRMVLSVSSAKSHVWGLPIDATGKAAGDASQITEGSYDEQGPSLSKDGGAMAFLSPRANGQRVFYRNLATGRAKELSPDGPGNYTRGAVFAPDGKGVISAHGGFLVYIPVSGGLMKTIWENPDRGRGGVSVPFSVVLWDLSPDGKTVLFFSIGDPSKVRAGVVRQVDLASGSAKTLLDDPDFELWQAHFSHDGRWVVFNATPHDGTSSRIYVAPFRPAPVPRSEWIPVTEGEWDDKPRFSADDKLIFFVSGAPGRPQRFWAQKLTSDMRPDGKPVAVYSPTHGRSVTGGDGISVSQHLIVFSQTESTGIIWLAEPAKRDAH
jgi:serine/threonine protein kinase